VTIPGEICKMLRAARRITPSQQPETGAGVVSTDAPIDRPVSTIDPFSQTALTKRVASFELTGQPPLRLNNTLRGPDTLPLRIVPA
jgi:hypothetical protein